VDYGEMNMCSFFEDEVGFLMLGGIFKKSSKIAFSISRRS
jgi:hypothetical protein